MPQATPERVIKLYPKITSAKTQYYELDSKDDAYIHQWLIQFLADLTELATHDEELKKEWFRRKPNAYPKGQKGPNSTASMVAGIISAKIKNPNHNISEPQLTPLEDIFDTIEFMYADEPNAPQRIKFQKSLFTQ